MWTWTSAYIGSHIQRESSNQGTSMVAAGAGHLAAGAGLSRSAATTYPRMPHRMHTDGMQAPRDKLIRFSTALTAHPHMEPARPGRGERMVIWKWARHAPFWGLLGLKGAWGHL